MANNRIEWHWTEACKGTATSETMYPLYCPFVSCCQVMTSGRGRSSSETHNALGASLLPTRIASKRERV